MLYMERVVREALTIQEVTGSNPSLSGFSLSSGGCEPTVPKMMNLPSFLTTLLCLHHSHSSLTEISYRDSMIFGELDLSYGVICHGRRGMP